MSEIKSGNPGFSPSSGVGSDNQISSLRNASFKRNTDDRKKELESFKSDSNVTINKAVKDFSLIKKAVDSAPVLDKSDQVAKLKKQINEGTYDIDYDKLVEKMFTSEF